jgi:hypothetical protein
MNVVSADSSCSVVWRGARAACAEVSTESVEASKAKHGPGFHLEPSTYGRILINVNTNQCINNKWHNKWLERKAPLVQPHDATMPL